MTGYRDARGLVRTGTVAAGVTAGVGAGCALVAGLALGPTGVVSGLVGAGVALAFCGSGGIAVLVAGDGRDGRAGAGYLVLGLNYALRLLLAVVVLTVAVRSSAVHRRVTGVTVVVCALCWSASYAVLATRRRRVPGLDLADPPRPAAGARPPVDVG